MKKHLLFAAFTFVLHLSEAQTITFPDATFKSVLLGYLPKIDQNNNGQIEVAEAQAVTELNVSNRSISDLKGIEYFSNLKTLNCSSNKLTSFDVSLNTALTELICAKNPTLDSIEFGTSGSKLQKLDCSQCNFSHLSVNGLPELVQLYCHTNHLTVLHTTGATKLSELYASSNQLSSYNLSSNVNMTYVNLGGNLFTQVDLSKNAKLDVLHLAGNPLSNVDLSHNLALTQFNCYACTLSSLDVTNNRNLAFLQCPINQLTTLDLSKNTRLLSIDCSSNRLSGTLDLTHTGVFIVDCRSNPNLNLICLPTLGPNSTTVYQKDAAAQWSTSCNVVTGLEEKERVSPSKKVIRVLTPLGQELLPEQATEGVFLLQYSDGSTRKVVK